MTAATISNRVRALEEHIGAELFSRHARGVRLNVRGREYAGEIRRILAEVATATERHREHAKATHLKLVAVEVVAEKWLMPRLADFKAAHPDISIEFETDHREVDPERRDFDVWIAFTDRVDKTLHVKTLFEETLIPVCSPDFLKIQGQPREPADLHGWPLLYDLHWTTYWSHWFAHHGAGGGGPVAGVGVPALQHDGSGRGRGHGRRPGPLTDDRARARAGNAGLPVRRPCHRAGPVPAGHDAGIRQQTQVRAFRDWVLHQAGGQSPHERIRTSKRGPSGAGRAPDREPGKRSDSKAGE